MTYKAGGALKLAETFTQAKARKTERLWTAESDLKELPRRFYFGRTTDENLRFRFGGTSRGIFGRTPNR